MKIYVLKHFWAADDVAPELDDIPYGCWAKKDAIDHWWRIMTTKEKKNITLVSSKH